MVEPQDRSNSYFSDSSEEAKASEKLSGKGGKTWEDLVFSDISRILGPPIDHISMLRELLQTADEEICNMRTGVTKMINAHQDKIHRMTTNMLKVSRPAWKPDELRAVLLKHQKQEIPRKNSVESAEDNILVKKQVPPEEIKFKRLLNLPE